jgi:hypothetical protein
VVMGAWYSSAVHQDRTLARMQQQPALFVVYIDQRQFRTRFPLIDRFLAGSYAPLAAVQSEGETIPILVHTRPPRGTDRETGWPCYRPSFVSRSAPESSNAATPLATAR